jgi:hypothetical protein
MSETTMRTEGMATRVDTMAATAVRVRKDLPAHHTRMNVREAICDIFAYIEGFYNPASEHPSGYVIEEKRLC